MDDSIYGPYRHFLRTACKGGAQRTSDDSADHDHDFEHLTPRGTSSVKAADEQKLLADPTSLLPQLHALLKTPAGREAFAAALNQQRSTNAGLNLEKDSFEHLGMCCVACDQLRHTTIGLLMLVVSVVVCQLLVVVYSHHCESVPG